jgi:choline dehydrogenase
VHDYVIIGAGSAGCVLANRLSEDPGTRVLLLEAGGPDRHWNIRVPAAFSKLFKGPHDWAYHTEPQTHMHGRRLYWPRGKVLGGSSSINAMIYIRGHRADYDQWRDLGNDGWGFADVLPYFKKAEHQERGSSEYHGVGGPLHVSDPRSPNVLSHAFVEAGVDSGLPRNDDFNGPTQEGVGFYQVTQKSGRRHSAAAAYLVPALTRPNLTVRTGVLAARVLFSGKRADGVEYLEDGVPRQEQAAREVILCGGAINSPQLLLLSGVGPADHLRALGVPVVADVPGVGENLQDHLAVPVAYRCTQPVTLDAVETIGNALRFIFFKRGPLTSNVAEAGAFVHTRPGLKAPDLQFHFGPVCYLDHGFTRLAGHWLTLGPTLIRPQSRGRITLRSLDPRDAPAIQPDYLAAREDVDLMVEGIRLSRSFAGAKAFHPFRGAEVYPGPEAQSADAMVDYLRARAETIYHPAGTCKMGKDSRAVVDARLRVIGVEGLRVVDASVMPVLVGGNTNAPVIMIAEKAADLIRKQ